MHMSSLLYQRLLADDVELQDLIPVLEELIREEGFDPTEIRRNAEKDDEAKTSLFADTHEDAAGLVYGASLVERVVKEVDEARVLDRVNLARKEKLSRQILLSLNDDEINFPAIAALLERFVALPVGESQVPPNITLGIRVYLINYLISNNPFYTGVAKHHINMRDVALIIDRIIGKYGSNSRVGGKSAGMLLANCILRPSIGAIEEWAADIDEVQSWFLTSQVFNAFMRHNKLEDAHGLKYLSHEEIDAHQERLKLRFLSGRMPHEIRLQLRELLRESGGMPLIVRSSSLLEDSLGFPFHGKYESHFVSNQGSEDERLEELCRAVARVYFGIFETGALDYRRDKDLLDYKEMMSVLVQTVVGKAYGKYFFPAFAGVAFSRNRYQWTPRIDANAGMMRLVMGLGTRAVDRSGDDYPRLVALSHPDLRPESGVQEQMRYSQRWVDVLNLETKEIETLHYVDLLNSIREQGGEQPDVSESVAVLQDGELVTSQEPFGANDRLEYGMSAITFDLLIRRTSFASLMKTVLDRLESEYGRPVDIEFAVQDRKLHILQCRPLADTGEDSGPVRPPARSADELTLFTTARGIFRNALVCDIAWIVRVRVEAYNRTQPQDRALVARAVGAANRRLRGERFVIMGPGRWGSSNTALGVPVGYGDINNCAALIEIAKTKDGYTPELSYGTHFFQDLVEAKIVPVSIYPDEEGQIFREDLMEEAPNRLEELCPDWGEMSQVVQVIRVSDMGHGDDLDMYLDADGGQGLGLLRE